MWRHLAQRLLFSIVTLALVTSFVFVIVRVIPGDPAQTMLGDQASQEALAALRSKLGLDRPILVQYLVFVAEVARGHWGVSMTNGRSVLGELLSVLPSTLELTFAALLIGTALGMPLGVLAALRRNRMADYAVRVGSLAGISFPAFVSGLFLLLAFAIYLPVFPVINAGGETLGERLHQLVLPAVNLGLIVAAYVTRVMRSAMLEVAQQDYVRTARAKGVPEPAVVWIHCLRNALLPVVTFLGLYTGILIGSAVLTEIVFSRPGLGKLIVAALNQRDYTTLQGLVLAYTIILIGINMVTDVIHGLIDPRIRHYRA
ncbi:MAG: ABC transporter permease [Alphaproteobacteria bacterium]|nr:ABC transporter permease [Alphaproteobacteria bacterium]